MAKGKKREKRATYVGSKSDLAKQQEEYQRIHPNANKKNVYFEDAPLVIFGVLFLWCVFLMVDVYVLNNLVPLVLATVIALCLIAMLHMSGTNRWIKSKRYRRPVLYSLFFVLLIAATLLVLACKNGYVIPLTSIF